MEKEFVTYEQALALKELGFAEQCFGLWTLNNGNHTISLIDICSYSKEFKYREVLAPLKQQVFRWFRDKYKIVPEIRNWSGSENQWYHMIYLSDGELLPWNWIKDKTYEEVESACIDELIEILKAKK